jgi:hypothetical protein
VSHTVIFGEAGQTLRHNAPEYVASATYEITDLRKAQDDADRIIASGVATVPSFTLTLDAAAGAEEADATIVPVTLTAGPSIGDTCVVIDSDGAFEAFPVVGISTDNYLKSGSWIAGNYAASDTVRGVTMTAPVPVGLYDFEDALDDQRPLRVVWQYTTAAGLRRVSEIIELRRGNRAAFDTGPALETLRLGYPTLATTIMQGLTLEALTAYSVEVVQAELTRRCIPHRDLMLGDPGRMLLVAKVLDEAAMRGYSPGTRSPETFRTEAAEEYSRQLEALAVGTQGAQSTQMDTDEIADNRASPLYQSPIQPL